MKSVEHTFCKYGEKECVYQKIMDSINDAVYILDRQLKITYFNLAAEKITGYTAKEAIGKPCFEIFRSDICHTDCPALWTLEKGEPIHEHFGKIVTREGKEVLVSSSIAPILNEQGQIAGTVVIFRDLSEIEKLKKSIANTHRLGNITSKNHQMQEIFRIIPNVAESDSNVLLQGATGTGKGLLARTICDFSFRKEKPFVPINCGAIPETLLESELFGYIKGAFTDAKKDKPGMFMLADSGTLFLDEISETSASFQVKLLKVLDEKEFYPLGSSMPIKVDVRIITATNRDLKLLVQTGAFREDLYYRLNILKIDLPPLCNRKEDILLLVEHILDKLRIVKRKEIRGVSEEVMRHLMNYDYPGNIRELQNIIEHAFVLCQGAVIGVNNLPLNLVHQISIFNKKHKATGMLLDNECRIIRETLMRHGEDRNAAARELGISRSTLWRKMKKINLNFYGSSH